VSAFLDGSARIAWREPLALWLLLLLPLMVLLRRKRGVPALGFQPFMVLRAVFAGSAPRRHSSCFSRASVLPFVLQAVAFLAVVLALAGPALERAQPLRRRGLDVMLCLDVSSSMATRDMDGRRTRLEVARAAAEEFVGGRPEDRIGLVGFARFPDLLAPLTSDHEVFRRFLESVRTMERDHPEDATGIGTALLRAAMEFGIGETGGERRKRSRVIILLTDGDENVAGGGSSGEIAPLHAAQLLKEEGVRVHVIAVGRRASDSSGTAAVAVRVRRVAEKTGGEFFRAGDARALAEVYAAIDRLERTPFEEPRYEVSEFSRQLVLLGLLAWFLGAGLGATIWRVWP